MSTDQNCTIFQIEDKWYLALEHMGAPKNAWDWFADHSNVEGPFSSEGKAEIYLRDNYANPGSIDVVLESELYPSRLPVYKAAVKRATPPRLTYRHWVCR